jgi:hypothetical protein
MNLTILSSEIINLKWNYQNTTDPPVKVPFEVPDDIISVDRSDLSKTLKLQDFVSITQPSEQSEEPMTLVVKNQFGNDLWTLNGMYLTEYLNQMDFTLNVNSSGLTGVIGLFEQTSSDLFLKNGVYSLWARDEDDPVSTGKMPGTNFYGTHPFVMGRSVGNTTATGWFGVFNNLAAA